MKDHYRRLTEIINWVKAEYPAFFLEAAREISDEERADTKRYHTCTHGVLYWSLNVDVTKAFLGKKKYNENIFTAEGKPVHCSYSHIRNYYIATLFGSHSVKVSLPKKYELEIVEFLDSTKKDKTGAKERGKLDEKEVDSISFKLYRLLC